MMRSEKEILEEIEALKARLEQSDKSLKEAMTVSSILEEIRDDIRDIKIAAQILRVRFSK